MISRSAFFRLFLQRSNHSASQLHHVTARHIHDGESYSKTNLVLMTKEDDSHNYIEAFSPIGFRLSSGFRILGPCAVFPKSVLHWNVASAEKISPASLSLFCLLEPKLDLLILGIGNSRATYDKNIVRYLRSKRINVEILPTEQACSTFNFLNSERRVVAAALIPPKDIGSEDIILSDVDDTMSLTSEAEVIPDDPYIRDTLQSFKTKGLVETVRDREAGIRKRSSPEFRFKDDRNEQSKDDPGR